MPSSPRKSGRAPLAAILFIGSLLLTAWQGAQALPRAYTGELRIELEQAFKLQVTGTGVATLSGPGNHLDALSLAAGDFATANLLVNLTDPFVAPIAGLQLTVQNGAGAFSGAPLGGAMPLPGLLRLCILVYCDAGFVPANVSIPLGAIGAGGASHVSSFVNLTVLGAPWTTGTIMSGALTLSGFVHGPASATSSTAATGGVVSLVTPVFVSTSIPGSSVLTGFSRLRLLFVPEPATALLLGAGVAALAWRGRATRRRNAGC